MIIFYVDDILAASNDATWLTSFKAQLNARFKIKDLGDLSQLMGMHITRDRSARTISLDQSKYLRDILAKYGMTDSKPSYFPMDPGFFAGLAHMISPPLPGWPRTSTQVCGRMHASRCIHGVEQPWLRPSIPHGRPLAGSKKVL
jgi:hypothetical protein